MRQPRKLQPRELCPASPRREPPQPPARPIIRAGLALAGPDASTILRKLHLLEDPSTNLSLSPLSLSPVRFHDQELWLVHAHSPLVARFEIWADPETLSLLSEAFGAAGASPSTPEAFNLLRILEGTPLYGIDIRNSDAARDLPQETATVSTPSRALHFAKGCYLGQEIVERIHSRGNVHRTFSGFLLDGTLPAAGTVLTSAENPDKPVGELTSVAALTLPSGQLASGPNPSGPTLVALGYIRREALDRNLPLRFAGGSATPATLPFPAAPTHRTPADSASA